MESPDDGIDTNVNNYSLSELMAIVGLNDISKSEVKQKTNYYINKYKTSSPKLSKFFSDIQVQLLSYAKGLAQKTDNSYLGNDTLPYAPDAVYPAGEKQSKEWYQEEVLQQNDKVQTDKITDRVQKIEVFGDYNHNPMNRQQLGVSNNFQVDVAQDTLNPNLKNTINKFVNIDSQYRQYSSGVETSSTDFTLDLSETLNNALSIKLYSYQLPFSWYTIDVAYNNTCFWITDGSNNIPITMPAGNYLAINFVNFLNVAFVQAGFSNFQGPPPNTPFISQYIYGGPDPSMNYPVYYNPNSGILAIFLYGAQYTAPVGSNYTDFQVSTQTLFTFFDPTSKLLCNVNCSNNNNYYNTTLGWLMGFRVAYVNVLEAGNWANSILDLNGTKYLMLIVDDYNQNHINSNIVSIAEYSNKLKLPSYYSPDLLTTCIPGTPNVSNIGSLTAGEYVQSIFDDQFSPDGGILISGKLNVEYNKTAQILPSAPRTLTQSQIYTINQINANNNNNTNYRVKAPTNNDVFAIIPVSTSGALTGQIKVDNGSALQLNIRTYFGPVNIERLRIKLVNDKGNVINLNGSDWCFTLICECLYQY